MSHPPAAVVVPTFPTFFQETDDPASVALALTIPADLNPTDVPGTAFPGLFYSLPSLHSSFSLFYLQHS
jgi:hypothetical protein